MRKEEPLFMKELHRIRARLAKNWEKMSDEEFVEHLHKVGQRFKRDLASKRNSSLLKK